MKYDTGVIVSMKRAAQLRRRKANILLHRAFIQLFWLNHDIRNDRENRLVDFADAKIIRKIYTQLEEVLTLLEEATTITTGKKEE
jgi:hypothetical protein